ncbi:hypothetical protein GCM10018987_52650 [Streptomyces cremeus]
MEALIARSAAKTPDVVRASPASVSRRAVRRTGSKERPPTSEAAGRRRGGAPAGEESEDGAFQAAAQCRIRFFGASSAT